MLLKANPPHFTILAASDAFLALVQKQRSELLSQDMLRMFPGNANDPSEKDNIFQSLQDVIRSKQTSKRPPFKYDIFKAETGKWVTEYWTHINEPVFDNTGEVAYIIDTTINVTQQMLDQQALQEAGELKGSLVREQELNDELAATVEELRSVNDELHESQDRLNSLNNQLEERVESRMQDIKNSERRFRSLVEQLPAAINVFLTQDLIVDLPNDRMLEIWGRTFDEVNGKPLAVGMPELEGQPFMQRLRDVIATGVPYISSEEKAFIQRNGKLEECYFDIVYQPIVNEDGTITSCLQIATEVTQAILSQRQIQSLNEELATINEELATTNEELSAANEELLQAQNDYLEVHSQLLKKGEDLVFTIDAATLATFDLNPNVGYFTGNPLLKSWFGLSPEEEIPLQEATDMIVEEDRERIISAINDALRFESGGNYDTEYTIYHPDHTTLRTVRAKGKTRFDENNQPIRLSGILQDITEQKRDEQRKNDFIGMVSHEMKTPLTSLSGFLQLLRMRIDGEDAIAANMLSKANKQVSRMTTLINGFLNVSRLESGKIHINKQPFDMSKLVKEAEEEALSLYNAHRIVFAPVDETFVNADKDKIGQVITNLISNAVKYSSADTVIHVACTTVDGMAVVSVKDEGIGIKEEDKDKLFERYYRVNHDNPTSISGFGIGLYLCSEIIQRHDGKIWVESEVGKGSTFSFALPVVG